MTKTQIIYLKFLLTFYLGFQLAIYLIDKKNVNIDITLLVFTIFFLAVIPLHSIIKLLKIISKKYNDYK